ncbi:hypothetical protein [Nocardioides sp. Soil805]|uniref:hypothetical protein n=1 Tax=Nocardioides sp. Soil805 TaxID=1736416 RepID=UPI0007036865|nr:hypothetical protein [Nocardioides sp. Soil805]KRF35275.1 hypothetical protein ASG94_14325 [Nocardioides sp. Soil805]
MVSRYYRDRLQAVLASADDESISQASNNWSTRATVVDDLADGLRSHGRTIDSEIEGQAGAAMVAKFNEISEKLHLAADDLRKGSGALGAAQGAAYQAIAARNGIQLSSPMNQPPTKPEGPLPGQQPTEAQSTAMGQYNSQMTQYLQNEQMYEDNAHKALQAMDKEYEAQAQVMKEIHGEPDPVDSPTTPGGSTPPSSPVVPPGTPGTPTRNPDVPDIRDPEVRDPEIRDPEIRDPEIRDPEIRDPEIRDPEIREPQPPITTLPPTNHPPHVPTFHPGTNVVGGTDGGFDYSPGSSPGGYTPSAPGGSGGGGLGSAGMAAGGVAGGAAGAAGLRGAAPAPQLRSAGVKGIGATTRSSGPGSLSRGSAAGARSTGSASRGSSVGGSRGAAGAKGASRTAAGAGSRSGTKAGGIKGATSRGAAGRSGASAAGKGSTTGSKGTTKGTAKNAAKAAGQGKGRGLFRRGSNGSASGGRGGKKNDERSEQRDALVYEQDWLGDESAGTGVLD